MSAIEQINKLIEQSEVEYQTAKNMSKKAACPLSLQDAGENMAFYNGRISGLKLALMAIEGSK